MPAASLTSGAGPIQDLGPAPQAPISQRVNIRSSWLDLLRQERAFLIMLGFGFLITGATYQTPHVAMWVGFAFAGYAAVSNDSIQTLGTFLASNKDKPWWVLWLFVGGIFLATMTYGWFTYAGDVSYGRLATKGFEEPTSFAYLQIAAPLFLIIITRLRMPVSTTFLLLSCFATSGKSIGAVLSKSLGGYVIAFVCAIVLWLTLGRWMQRKFVGEAHPGWRVFQWGTTGVLWSVWLMQDAANIAVYLPRQLSGGEFFAFAAVIFLGLGVLLRKGGDKIQEVVDEKSDVVDVRAASVIDLLFAAVLIVFKFSSSVPMSTTWVFLGLLAGRELAMALRRSNNSGHGVGHAWRLMRRDIGYAAAGLLVSLVLAAATNSTVREALFGDLIG
jgi:hypothetical protein